MKVASLVLLTVTIGCAHNAVRKPSPEASMNVRTATAADVSRMVELSGMKRAQYETYSPVFWRSAADASERQRKFFEGLVTDASWICLVNEPPHGVDGFIIARVVPAPPVYDPGGKVCMIDDFMVADASLWPTVGMALRDEADRRAAAAGAVLSVTVCGQRDVPKRTALQDSGAHVASEWYVRTIPKNRGE